jgi:hypothetical protein
VSRRALASPKSSIRTQRLPPAEMGARIQRAQQGPGMMPMCENVPARRPGPSVAPQTTGAGTLELRDVKASTQASARPTLELLGELPLSQ